MTNIVNTLNGANKAVTSEIATPSFSEQIKTIQKRSALLEEFTPVLVELNAAKAKVKLAETQYAAANPNGNLQSDGNKLENEKLKLYRQIIGQPTNKWVTNPDETAALPLSYTGIVDSGKSVTIFMAILLLITKLFNIFLWAK